MFAAEAKQAGFNIIRCVVLPRHKAKIIASLSVYITLPKRKECCESLWCRIVFVSRLAFS